MLTLDFTSLKQTARNLLAARSFGDLSEFSDHFSKAVSPNIREQVAADIATNGVPSDMCGYRIDTPEGHMEVLLAHYGEGRYIPSVSSDWYEAKANTWDPVLAMESPVEALTSGIIDALCNLFGSTLQEA